MTVDAMRLQRHNNKPSTNQIQEFNCAVVQEFIHNILYIVRIEVTAVYSMYLQHYVI